MRVAGKIRIISGIGISRLGTFEETVEAISEVLGIYLEESQTDEFEPFRAYSTVALGLTVVLLDPSSGGVDKDHYELQVYGGSQDKEKDWVDISEYLIDLIQDNLEITSKKL